MELKKGWLGWRVLAVSQRGQVLQWRGNAMWEAWRTNQEHLVSTKNQFQTAFYFLSKLLNSFRQL